MFTKFIKILILFLIISGGEKVYSQNTGKENGHFLAALDFFGNYPSAKYKINHQGFPDNSLLNTKDTWYQENDIRVRGLVKSAALVIDWWILLGEPTENYIFKWNSSNYFEIDYTDKKGKEISTTISRSSLEKYPDLLKRFDALQPLDIKFQITWHMGSLSDQDYQDFRKRYNLMGTIGAAMPYLDNAFTTNVNNGMLFEPSGKTPFAVPGIRQDKGQEFFGLPSNYDSGKFRMIITYFNQVQNQVINNFKVTSIRWPIGEMKAIAELYDDYEHGKKPLSPKEQIAKADSLNQNLQAYNKGDEMSEAFVDEVRNTEVIRDKSGITMIKANNKITYSTQDHQINTTSNKRLFFSSKYGEATQIIDFKGRVITINNKTGFDQYRCADQKKQGIGTCDKVNLITVLDKTLVKSHVWNYNPDSEGENYSSVYSDASSKIASYEEEKRKEDERKAEEARKNNDNHSYYVFGSYNDVYIYKKEYIIYDIKAQKVLSTKIIYSTNSY